MCVQYAYYRGVVQNDMIGTKPLPDLVHDNVMNMQPYRIVPEILYLVPIVYLGLLVLYYRHLEAFRFFMTCHANLILCRALSFSGTTLPDPSQMCHVSIYVGGCHDLIFSGHVMIMTLCVLELVHFFPLWRITRLYFYISSSISAFMVISTRNHYTVDVYLSLYITVAVFFLTLYFPPLIRVWETPRPEAAPGKVWAHELRWETKSGDRKDVIWTTADGRILGRERARTYAGTTKRRNSFDGIHERSREGTSSSESSSPSPAEIASNSPQSCDSGSDMVRGGVLPGRVAQSMAWLGTPPSIRQDPRQHGGLRKRRWRVAGTPSPTPGVDAES